MLKAKHTIQDLITMYIILKEEEWLELYSNTSCKLNYGLTGKQL